MRFNSHSELEGKHAYLSASKYHWIRYTEEKFDNNYRTALAAFRGTELHQLAFDLIRLNEKLARSKKTLNAYVNDAIGYKMTPELLLYYSDNAFGTADAVSFRNNFLRIHDLKTGVSKASFDQLMIYVAFFCLEYGFKPGELQIELRIYQNDDVEIMVPDVEDIVHIMDRIIMFDARIESLKREVLQ